MYMYHSNFQVAQDAVPEISSHAKSSDSENFCVTVQGFTAAVGDLTETAAQVSHVTLSRYPSVRPSVRPSVSENFCVTVQGFTAAVGDLTETASQVSHVTLSRYLSVRLSVKTIVVLCVY